MSPHLGIYSWLITNTLSIVHRLTGIALSVGLLILVCWLVALASGPQTYADVHAFYSSIWFKPLLVGWAFCFFFHLANGVRHLVWDTGRGFGHGQIRGGGWTVVVVSAVAAAAYSIFAIY